MRIHEHCAFNTTSSASDNVTSLKTTGPDGAVHSLHSVISLHSGVSDRPGLAGAVSDSEAERRYIEQEARSLFRQNQQLTDPESIRRCIEECEARIEIGLHYRNPYPRATYLPPLGLATQRGRRLRAQQRLRKQAKPVYLQSHDDT